MNQEHTLSPEDLELLNSKTGLYQLLNQDDIDLDQALEQARYTLELKELQAEMVKAQEWVIKNNKKVVVLFEGRDLAGKGGAIRRLSAHINPRFFRTIALPAPTAEERGQWYFQRYVSCLPNPGEMVFFDRSWYNRAVVEPVNGFCTLPEYETFMDQVNNFESMIMQANTIFLKFYLSISREEQNRRFKLVKNDPLKRWKITPLDEKAQALWDEYTIYKNKMFERTSTEAAPWHVVEADSKSRARLQIMRTLLDHIPYI